MEGPTFKLRGQLELAPQSRGQRRESLSPFSFLFYVHLFFLFFLFLSFALFALNTVNEKIGALRVFIFIFGAAPGPRRAPGRLVRASSRAI